MAIKDVLFLINDSEHGISGLSSALALCSEHEAFLTVLCVNPPQLQISYDSIASVSFSAPEIPIQIPVTKPVRPEFVKEVRDAASQAGIELKWIEMDTLDETGILEQARLADLTILTQDIDGEARFNNVLSDDFLTHTGRPTMIIPHIGGNLSSLNHIMVAWDAGQASTRAVHDAMPLLTRADNVCITSIFSGGEEKEVLTSCTQLATHLQHHGCHTTINCQPLTDQEIASTLLNHASDKGTDLLVMGAYGHSRLRELFFGGATRTLLESMTIPLLVSH